MSETGHRTVVSVHIAGEEFTIRSVASDEYTRECAEYVDRMVRDVLEGAPMLQAQRAPVLAALAITDQLFRANRELADLRAEAGKRAMALASEIERTLQTPGLATPS